MKEELILKKVDSSSLHELQKISRITFIETYDLVNTRENMNAYLTYDFGLEKLKSEICDINSSFYFALLGNQIIGYLKVNSGLAQTTLNDDRSLEIERIYVLKEHIGKRVGKFLIDKAFSIATEIDAKYIWLGVWEKNTRAIQFYKKNRFIEFDKHIFILGKDEQTDLLMRCDFEI